MTLAKVKNNFQLTIPRRLRDKLKLSVGDFVEIENKDCTLIIKPVKMVHPDQEYFYSKEWQEGEAEADKDIAEGHVSKPVSSVKELIKDLKS